MKILSRQWLPEKFPPWKYFSAATFRCCLFIGLSAVCFVSNWKAVIIVVRPGDWLCHWRIFYFFCCLREVLICLHSTFRVIITYTAKCCSFSFVVFGLMCAESMALNTSELILILLLVVTSSVNTFEPAPFAAIHSHDMTLPTPCLTHDAGFGSSAVLSFSRHLSLFLSHLSKECDCRTCEAFMDVLSYCSWIIPEVCTLL